MHRQDPRHTTLHPSPLRVVPLFTSPASLFRPTPRDFASLPQAVPFVPRTEGVLFGQPTAALTPREHAEGLLRVAEAAQHTARRAYVKARAAIGLANRTSRPASRWDRGEVYTAEQVRARRSTAFRAFNRALAALRAADRDVAAARVALAH